VIIIRSFTGAAILIVAIVLLRLRMWRAAHVVGCLGTRIGPQI
jgi:hypothetical protein